MHLCSYVIHVRSIIEMVALGPRTDNVGTSGWSMTSLDIQVVRKVHTGNIFTFDEDGQKDKYTIQCDGI